jgi:glutamine synthetase
VEGERGNSLNIAMSLWKTSEQNILYDGKEEYGQVSQTGRYFIGGLLEHANALCLFTSPTPNSYRKLSMEQLKFGWSCADHDSLVFVPNVKKNLKESKRVVFRASDPSANPYLAFAVVAAAGLDGIKKKVDPGEPVESDKKKRAERSLPSSLYAAIKALESDTTFLKGTVPAELLGDFLDLKLKQHQLAMSGITGHELQRYWNV